MADREGENTFRENPGVLAERKLFQSAFAFHRLGKLAEAKKLYDEVLISNPGHFDALHHSGMIARRFGAPWDAEELFVKALLIREDFAPLHCSYGLLLHDLGRFDEALGRFDRALCLAPDFVQAYYNKGLTFQALKVFDSALACFDKTVTIQPDFADAYVNRANIFKGLNQLEDALAGYDRGVVLRPDYGAAFNNRGVTLKDLRRFDEALISYDKAIAIDPHDIGAFNNRGVALQQMGRIEQAISSFEMALLLNPGFSLACYNCGAALEELKRFEEALGYYEKAITLNPYYADAHNNRGNAYKSLGRLEEALASYDGGVAINPFLAECHNNRGVTLQELKRLHEALVSFGEAIVCKPDYAGAYSNLGVVLKEVRRFDEAVACYDRAIAVKPDYADAHNNLGVARQELKRFDEAIVSFQTAIAWDPDHLHAHSNLLFTMNYLDSLTPRARREEAERFGASVARKARVKFSEWRIPKSGERLRIGFVSGDFRNHPVGYFLEGLVAKLDQTRFDLFAYNAILMEDELTHRLKSHIPVWRSLCGLNDAEAARVIHADGLHVLIDLSGHTAGNRLGIFAHKPAPVQASWLGYFATTGVAEIDFFVGDSHVAPQEEEHHFCERVIRLPESYLCFTPPQNGVEVGALPAHRNGYVTFGCFNNLAKMNHGVVVLWAKVLRAVDGSRLLLKSAQLGDPVIIQNTRDIFGAAGVTPDRLLFEGPSNRIDYFESFNRVDIALDPFPFPGGTTSVEGLWMGVPVITLRGDRFIAHNGETIAHNSGQSAWIAQDEEDYIRKAVAFSSDLVGLAALRSGLRKQVLGSPLFDSDRFARHFEALVREMWSDYKSRVSGSVQSPLRPGKARI